MTTDEQNAIPPARAGGNDGKPPPLTPSPGVLVIAVALLAALVYNLRLDATTDGYNGSWATYALVILIGGVLGVDVSRFWRGGKGDE